MKFSPLFLIVTSFSAVHSASYCSWGNCAPNTSMNSDHCDASRANCENDCHGGTYCTSAPTTRAPTPPPSTSAPISPAYGGGPSPHGCKFPSGTLKYSVITKGDADIAAHNVYLPILIGGHLTDPNPSANIVVNTRNIGGPSYMNSLASNANINFHGGKQTGVNLEDVIDFEQFEWLAQHAKSSYINGKKVVVMTSGGTFDTYDFKPGGQAEDNGNTLVIFNTSEKVVLTKTHDGRQFGPSVIAPFSHVNLRSEAG